MSNHNDAATRMSDALSLCDEVLAAVEGDVEHGEEKWGVSQFIWSLARRGAFVLAYMGRLREAYRDLERALALARQRERDEVLGWILGCYVTDSSNFSLCCRMSKSSNRASSKARRISCLDRGVRVQNGHFEPW